MGYKILNSSNYGTYGNKGNSNYGIDLNKWKDKKPI
jgi:hypothetical protein